MYAYPNWQKAIIVIDTEEYNFDTGFTYKGISYGWYKGVLCRLPYENLKRYHSIKRVALVKGFYRLGGCRKSSVQVNKMAEKISYTYTHCFNTTPF